MSSPPALPRPDILSAEYIMTTPAFIGDGDKITSSIRPPSVKGALRFWWRAMRWPRIIQALKSTQDNNGHSKQALAQLHQEERRLFGSASGSKDEEVGQGVFNLIVRETKVSISNQQLPGGLSYLLGQGIKPDQQGYITAGSKFQLDLVLNNRVSEQQKLQLEETLLLWGMLGGLGARSRKGLGSVSIQSLTGEHYQAPQNEQDYRALLNKLLPLEQMPDNLPPFTAFSARTRIDISLKGEKALDLLSDTGEKQQLYRSWGQNGKVNGQPALQLFKDDHDNSLRMSLASSKRDFNYLPKRAVFGLPHNYYFSSSRTFLNINTSQDDKAGTGQRRASPLFIHVHQFPNSQQSSDDNCLLVHSLLEAVFLPHNARIDFSARKAAVRRGSTSYREVPVNYRVIHRYLNHFTEKKVLYIHSSYRSNREQEARQ